MTAICLFRIPQISRALEVEGMTFLEVCFAFWMVARESQDGINMLDPFFQFNGSAADAAASRRKTLSPPSSNDIDELAFYVKLASISYTESEEHLRRQLMDVPDNGLSVLFAQATNGTGAEVSVLDNKHIFGIWFCIGLRS